RASGGGRSFRPRAAFRCLMIGATMKARPLVRVCVDIIYCSRTLTHARSRSAARLCRASLRSLALAAGAAFTIGSAYAQPVPPRDRLPPPATGTAIIKGRVVDAQTGNALPRARVRLPGPGNRPPVLTDETGAFK